MQKQNERRAVHCPFKTGARRRGFSLVEVLISVGMVGLLMGVAIPGIRYTRYRVAVQEAETQLVFIATAVRQLAWDTGRWPGAQDKTEDHSIEIWDLKGAKAGLLATDGDYRNWRGPYIDRIPLDPWGNPFFFDPDYHADGEWHVVVGSFGPNGQGRNYYDQDNIYVILK